jgi:hypothetical protein
MKVAGHELKSVQRYYGNDGVHVPLMALVSLMKIIDEIFDRLIIWDGGY